ncbi:alpha/beta fold hydrolase [Nocardia asteroides]|uniref:alpha/beta fold hydrolase n=1 Tax=Nocardia asteroides TaxID=1824 RepID=UPI001E3A7A1C|nr:alpha/beta hydrolase [Nocardia asteroides]UGT55542.1 alpha/beta hydrolase [Nocardia asteroides]
MPTAHGMESMPDAAAFAAVVERITNHAQLDEAVALFREDAVAEWIFDGAYERHEGIVAIRSALAVMATVWRQRRLRVRKTVECVGADTIVLSWCGGFGDDERQFGTEIWTLREGRVARHQMYGYLNVRPRASLRAAIRLTIVAPRTALSAARSQVRHMGLRSLRSGRTANPLPRTAFPGSTHLCPTRLANEEIPMKHVDQRHSSLGTAHERALTGGTIRYYDTGDGPPVVFVHGFMTNATTWRNVVPHVAAAGHRCIAPDLPLGAHSIPVPDADLTPVGVADMLSELLDELDLTDVTVVANDSGGVITQILLARNLARVSRVVLASVDCYEAFPPTRYRWLTTAIKIPGATRVVTAILRFRPLQRLPFTFGPATKRPIPPEVMDGFLLPSRHSSAIRADLAHFVSRGVSNEFTLAAAREFPSVTTPVLIAWAREDRLVPAEYAERLATDLPHATLAFIDDSFMLVQEDRPDVLSEMIIEFVRQHVAPPQR